MSIGEFAQLSGMTIKALRHYDERGLLVPAHVDPESRYRTYAGSQLRDAVTIKALRDAGVPVGTVRRALAEPDQVGALLAEFRAALVAERDAQDAALAAATHTLAALETPVPVFERDAEPVHYAAVVQHIADDAATADAATADERANEGFAALFRTLRQQGNPPVGPFWSSFGAMDAPDTVELWLCWPVARPLPTSFTVDSMPVRVGTLPARRELVASWRHGPDDPVLGEALHPAVVALLDEMDTRRLACDLASLRQIGIMGDEGPVGVELALAVR